MKHWVYRFVGTYSGLVEDMDRIARNSPGIEIINVQRVGDAGKVVRSPPDFCVEHEYEYLVYTRRAL